MSPSLLRPLRAGPSRELLTGIPAALRNGAFSGLGVPRVHHPFWGSWRNVADPLEACGTSSPSASRELDPGPAGGPREAPAVLRRHWGQLLQHVPFPTVLGSGPSNEPPGAWAGEVIPTERTEMASPCPSFLSGLRTGAQRRDWGEIVTPGLPSLLPGLQRRE